MNASEIGEVHRKGLIKGKSPLKTSRNRQGGYIRTNLWGGHVDYDSSTAGVSLFLLQRPDLRRPGEERANA